MARDTCRAVHSNLPGATFSSQRRESQEFSSRLSNLLETVRQALLEEKRLLISHFSRAFEVASIRPATSEVFFASARSGGWRLAGKIMICLAVVMVCVGGELQNTSGARTGDARTGSVYLSMGETGDEPLNSRSWHAKLWEGNWDTTYGQLRLVQEGNRVYGDFHVRGVIEGRASEDGSLLKGTFLFSDGRWGRFEFVKSRHAFVGSWHWHDDTPIVDHSWKGSRSSALPDQLVLADEVELQKLRFLNRRRFTQNQSATGNF